LLLIPAPKGGRHLTLGYKWLRAAGQVPDEGLLHAADRSGFVPTVRRLFQALNVRGQGHSVL
jgi:hypothetical protein